MYSRTKSQLLAQMDVAMGGRVAEELSKNISNILLYLDYLFILNI